MIVQRTLSGWSPLGRYGDLWTDIGNAITTPLQVITAAQQANVQKQQLIEQAQVQTASMQDTLVRTGMVIGGVVLATALVGAMVVASKKRKVVTPA